METASPRPQAQESTMGTVSPHPQVQESTVGQSPHIHRHKKALWGQPGPASWGQSVLVQGPRWQGAEAEHSPCPGLGHTGGGEKGASAKSGQILSRGCERPVSPCPPCFAP